MNAFDKMSEGQKKAKKSKTKKSKTKKSKTKKVGKPTYSLTVGNGGENHTGMQFIGSMRKKGEGWNLERLLYAKGILEDVFNLEVELYNLNDLLEGVEIEEGKEPEPAHFMLVKTFLHPDVHQKILLELETYKWDNKYWDTRRQKVLNKRARENVYMDRGNLIMKIKQKLTENHISASTYKQLKY